MIRINLLPHREEKRRARRQQFFVLGALTTILASLIVFLVWSIINGYIHSQEGRNTFLKGEIASLDKQIAQIKTLKEEINRLLAKKQVIESLQRDRGFAVGMLNELAVQVPEGVYLKSMRQIGMQVSLTGYAQSNSRVSEFMRNLELSPVFESPALAETKAAVVDRRSVQEFNLSVRISPVRVEAPKPVPAAVSAPAAEKK